MSFFCIYLLVMPKYWGKQIFNLGRFPEVGQKQKTEREKEKKKERLTDGDNNDQATHDARKHAWRTQAAWANFFECLYCVCPTLALDEDCEYSDSVLTETGGNLEQPRILVISEKHETVWYYS